VARKPDPIDNCAGDGLACISTHERCADPVGKVVSLPSPLHGERRTAGQVLE
jgi:hypothetical protein